MDDELASLIAEFTWPAAVDRRLQALLDKRDRVEVLTVDEYVEAEGLVELSDLMSWMKTRAR